ncbi:hypothetical protein PQR34_40270 [Paraburkholderia sediminicola]|uniref:hypothetical protein n=1 Tax=Paraburkholderia sediminicola TaxID=458836 RepID=UPI0038B7978D
MKTPNNFTLTLPQNQMEVVFTALAELPYRVAQPVMDAAEVQIAEQVAALRAAQQPAASADVAAQPAGA